jgi:Ca2+/Na+ antiporter
MLDTLLHLESSVYIQVGLLVILLLYFFTHRKAPRHLVSGLSLARTLGIFLLFVYLLWNWASAVSPQLRTASILGMCLVNLYMVWNVVLTRLERPYRDALEACGRAGGKAEGMEQAWRTGKRFYYWRYFTQGLFSGHPGRFLNNLAGEQVREDLKSTFHRLGVKQNFLTLKTLVAYLKKQLAQDDTLPQDFRTAMAKVMENFAGHAWIEVRVNQFLTEMLESPEKLFSPEWAAVQDEPAPPPSGQAGG